MIQLHNIVNDTDKKDIFDFVLPQLTISERSELLKLLVGPIMFILIKYY